VEVGGEGKETRRGNRVPEVESLHIYSMLDLGGIGYDHMGELSGLHESSHLLGQASTHVTLHHHQATGSNPTAHFFQAVGCQVVSRLTKHQ
jgi:hypothetical protein